MPMDWLELDDKEISYRDVVASLLTDMNDGDIEERLGLFFVLKEDGIYRAKVPTGIPLTDQERYALTGHPHNDLSKPALAFPCLPKQLKTFLEWTESEGLDVQIDLELMERLVLAKPSLPNYHSMESDAALGAQTRARNTRFSNRSRDASQARTEQHEKWRACSKVIQESRTKPISKRALAERVKEKLNLRDSVETIRKAL